MLRDEILLWILIVWLMCTCIIVMDIYTRMEAQASVKEPIKDTVQEIVKPVVQETEQKPTVEITAKEIKTYYDVPLYETLQDHIFKLCAEHNIDPAIVIAMIHKESRYNPDAIGDGGNSLGLMQIQPKWHKERMKKLGVRSLLDPYNNVTVGIDILAELFSTGKSTEWVLMAYNGGRSYANEKEALGIVTDYANTVIANARTFEKYEVVVE